MSWLMTALLLIASYLILVPLLSYLSTKRLIGKKIAVNDHGDKDQLIYFYSPKCAPCRKMTPVIKQLAEHHNMIRKIDIQSNPEMARNYRIRATPTLILIKNGIIDDIALGAKTPAQIETLLNKIL
jgi:thioredoxin 1